MSRSVLADEEAVAASPVAMATVKGEFRRGAWAMLPLTVGYAPFGCLIGVAVAASSTPAAAWSGVWLIFGGTAHLAAVQLVDTVSMPVAVLSALVINIRLAVFSATLAPHWQGTRLRTRLVAAATIIDPTWMLASRRFAEPGGPAAGRRYYYGAAAVLWFCWAGWVTVGMVAGNFVPPQAGLHLLAPLCLIAMLIPGIRSVAAIACAGAAATVAVLGAQLPAGSALLIAMPAGVVCAMIAGRTGRKEA